MKLADLLTAVGHPSLTAETPAHPVEKEASATDQTIAELFRAQVRAAPDSFAVNGPDSRWTYSQLDRQSDRLAFILRQHGVQPEGAVALIMTRSPCVVVAMLAALKAGAAYVPILPTDPVERIQHIVRDTRSRVLISEYSLQEFIQSVLHIIPECAAILVARDSHGRPEAIDGENGTRADGPGSIRFLTCDTLNEVVDPPAKRASPASLAYVMYTSGTSGRPKGVMIEQRNIVQLVIRAGYIEIQPSDRILQAGSLAFDAATFEIWGALLNGASVYIAPQDALLRSDTLRKLIQCEQITILFLTTALFNQLTDESSDVFEGIRVLLTGGECVSASHMMRVRQRYPNLELLHVYGPTENTTFTTAFRVEGDFELDVPIGRPIGGDVVSVLGADLKPQPAGVPGELCTGGCGLARGYLNDAALTAEKFIPDPEGDGRRIYRTGDLACWNCERGLEPVLEFRGRVDDQVKIRGFRVESAEIEARLREINGVRDAAVMVRMAEKRVVPITSPPGRSWNADPGPAKSFAGEPGLEVFDRLESRVRSYCRSFPKVFQRAQGAWLYDREGKAYIDFLCGAGSLNYGHNPPALKRALVNYIEADGIAHALDLATGAKERFLLELESTILRPRQLDYRVQFVSPSGANGIEASLKLARKIKRRHTVVAFTNGYHGLSSGALSVTADAFYRGEDYTQRSNVAFMPFDGYFGGRIDTLDYFERYLSDCGSGLDRPAAVIIETVQAEGGINVARLEWLQGLARLCERFDMLLIVDDIQVGCGRTGTFFSFETAGLYPDIVVLSKSISGFGLPMSVVLLKPALDVWKPGEHTGTFRGNNLAFVTGTAALEFWRDGQMQRAMSERSAILEEELTRIADAYPELHAGVRGIGLIFGVQIEPPDLARSIVKKCFAGGVIAELCGPRRNVLKFLPPLVIEPDVLCEGLRRIRGGIEAALSDAVS